MQNFGLKEKTVDKRDLKVGALLTLPAVNTLPFNFEVPIPDEWILTQGDDNCAPHATSLASSLQEGVRLDPNFTGAMARYITKADPDDWGIELRDMANAHVKIGAVELKDAQYQEFEADWHDVTKWNIEQNLLKSVINKKGSFISIERENGMDWYDTIRATLVAANKTDLKTAVVIGTRWPYGTQPDVPEWIDGGYGHASVIYGYTRAIFGNVWGERLLDAGSWGLGVGNRGRFTLCRDVINKEVGRFGALFFVDETPEKLREYIAKGIKLDSSWSTNLIQAFITKIIQIINAFTSQISFLRKSGTSSAYKWDTPFNARHSVRVICDEEGLTWDEKEIIAACIKQESGFKNWVTCQNKDKNGIVWSTDWGICQINDYWNIGKNRPFPSVQHVLDNPDKVVRWMIKMMKAGKLTLWASYSSGAYKKYINNNNV